MLNFVDHKLSWVLLVSCHCVFTSISRVQNFSSRYFMGPPLFLWVVLWSNIFFLWVFCGFTIFSSGYFLSPIFFLWVDISVIQHFLLWIFPTSKSFSFGYFVGPTFFLKSILWVHNFF